MQCLSKDILLPQCPVLSQLWGESFDLKSCCFDRFIDSVLTPCYKLVNPLGHYKSTFVERSLPPTSRRREFGCAKESIWRKLTCVLHRLHC